MMAINFGSSLLTAAGSAAAWPLDNGGRLLTDANAGGVPNRYTQT
jgi:hypothetical protein